MKVLDRLHIESQKGLKRAYHHSTRQLSQESMMQLLNIIDDVERRRRVATLVLRLNMLSRSPENEWNVYEVCKRFSELAFYDGIEPSFVDFVSFFRDMVPYVDPMHIEAGVMTYQQRME